MKDIIFVHTLKGQKILVCKQKLGHEDEYNIIGKLNKEAFKQQFLDAIAQK